MITNSVLYCYISLSRASCCICTVLSFLGFGTSHFYCILLCDCALTDFSSDISVIEQHRSIPQCSTYSIRLSAFSVEDVAMASANPFLLVATIPAKRVSLNCW